MMDIVRDAALEPRDVVTAQNVLDAWLGDLDRPGRLVEVQAGGRSILELRGILAVALADARAAGYVEGVHVGRREAGHLVQECLQGEGLL